MDRGDAAAARDVDMPSATERGRSAARSPSRPETASGRSHHPGDALRVPQPERVASAAALADWYAVLASVPCARLVLRRRREIEDALDESEDPARRQHLEFLRRDLDRDWHCDRAPRNFVRRVTTQLSAAILLAARYEEKFKQHGSALQRSAAIYQLLLARRPSGRLEPLRGRSILSLASSSRGSRNFERKTTFDRLRGVGDPSVSQVQFLDKPTERGVYRRCMDMDFERDLDEPIKPVSLRAKVVACFVAAFLIVGPIAFLLFFGRNMTKSEQWDWWKVAMFAIALIVFVVEPLRILFLNFVLPKVLLPKIKHYSDPAQIATPYFAAARKTPRLGLTFERHPDFERCPVSVYSSSGRRPRAVDLERSRPTPRADGARPDV